MADETKKAPRATVEREDEKRAADDARTDDKAQAGTAPGATASESAKDGAKDAATPKVSGFDKAASWVHKTFPGNENAFFGGVCGLIVAILILFIGFWSTLLIVLVVLVGVAIGQQADGNPKIIRAVSRFFEDRRH